MLPAEQTKTRREVTLWRINAEFVTSTNEPGEYRDAELKGFTLRIQSKGSPPVKVYLVMGRIKGGDPIRYTIGRHGAPWTAKAAREKARQIINMLKDGIDPRVAEEKQRLEDRAFRSAQESEKKLDELTVRLVFQSWKEKHHQTKDLTKSLYENVIYKHLDDWLDLPMKRISRSMVSERYEQTAKVTLSSANMCFKALGMLFNWSKGEYRDDMDNPLIAINPIAVLSEKKLWRKLEPRDSYIDDIDLPIWFSAVLALKNKSMSNYFKLLLVTGLRRDEAKTLAWKDVNFKRKHFTVRNTKNGRPLTLPMTPFVEGLFKECEKLKRNDFVFPGEGPRGHITDVRHHYHLIQTSTQIAFTPHALRRTFAYAAARQRLGESERKALLNHLDSSDVTEASYTPWQIDQLREPIKLVEDFLLSKAIEKEKSEINSHVL